MNFICILTLTSHSNANRRPSVTVHSMVPLFNKVPVAINLKTTVIGVVKELPASPFLNTGRIGELKLIQRVEVFIYQHLIVPGRLGSKSTIKRSKQKYLMTHEWIVLTTDQFRIGQNGLGTTIKQKKRHFIVHPIKFFLTYNSACPSCKAIRSFN